MPPKKPVMKAVHKPKADFKKLKRKVGKSIPIPQNATKTTITSKSIAMPVQKLEEKTTPTNAHNQTLGDLLIMLVHYNSAIRKDAYAGMNDLFNRHNGVFAKELPRLISRFGEGVIDPSPEVRNACCVLTYQHFGTISEGRMGPLFPVYIHYVIAALSHIDPGVRSDAVHFLRLLIILYPELVLKHCHQVLPNFSSLLADRNIASSQAQSASLSVFTSTSMSSSNSTSLLPSSSVHAARLQRSSNSAKKQQLKALGAAGLFGSNSHNNEDQILSILMHGASSSMNTMEHISSQSADLNSFTSIFNLDTVSASASSTFQSISAGLLTVNPSGMSHMHLSLALLDSTLRLRAPTAEAQFLEDILSEYIDMTKDKTESSVWKQTKLNAVKRSLKRTTDDAKASNINEDIETSDSDDSSDDEDGDDTAQSSKPSAATTSKNEIVFAGRNTATTLIAQPNVSAAEQKPVRIDEARLAFMSQVIMDPLQSLITSQVDFQPEVTKVEAPQTNQSKPVVSKPEVKQHEPTSKGKLNSNLEPVSMFSQDTKTLSLPSLDKSKLKTGNTSGQNSNSKSNEHLLSSTKANASNIATPDLSQREHIFLINSISDELATSLIECWVESFPLEWLSQEDREDRGTLDLSLSRHYDLHGVAKTNSVTRGDKEAMKAAQQATGANKKQKGGNKAALRVVSNAKSLSANLSILGYVASCLLSLARCDLAAQQYTNVTKTQSSRSETYFDQVTSQRLNPPLANHFNKLLSHILPYFPLSATSTHDIRAVAMINLSLAQLVTLYISTTPSALPPVPPRLALRDSQSRTSGKQVAKMLAKKTKNPNDPYVNMSRQEWDAFVKRFESIRQLEQYLLEYVMSSYQHHQEQEYKSQSRLAHRMESRERTLYGYEGLVSPQDGPAKRKAIDGPSQPENVSQVSGDKRQRVQNNDTAITPGSVSDESTYLGIIPLPDLIRTTWALLPHVSGPVQTWLVDTFSAFYASCSVSPLSPAKLQCIPLIAALLHQRGNGSEWFKFGFPSSVWLPSLPQLLSSALESCASQKPLTANFTARSLATFPLRYVAANIAAVMSYATRTYSPHSNPIIAKTLSMSLSRQSEAELRHHMNALQRKVSQILETRKVNSSMGHITQSAIFNTSKNTKQSSSQLLFDWDALQADFSLLIQKSFDCVLPSNIMRALEDVSPFALSLGANAKAQSHTSRLYQPGPIFSVLASNQTQISVLHSMLFASLVSPSLLSSLAFLCRFSSNSSASPFGIHSDQHRGSFSKESKLLPEPLRPELRISLIELVSQCHQRLPIQLYLSFLMSSCLASSDLTVHPAFSPLFHLDPTFLTNNQSKHEDENLDSIQNNTHVVEFAKSPLAHLVFPLAQLSHPSVTAAVLTALSHIQFDSDKILKYISLSETNDVNNSALLQEATVPLNSQTKTRIAQLLVPNKWAHAHMLLDMMSGMITSHLNNNSDAVAHHYLHSLSMSVEKPILGFSKSKALNPLSDLVSSLPLVELPACINIGRLVVILTHILQSSIQSDYDETKHIPTISITLFRSLAKAISIWLPLLCDAHVNSLPSNINDGSSSILDIDFSSQPEAPFAVVFLLQNIPGLLSAILSIWANQIESVCVTSQKFSEKMEEQAVHEPLSILSIPISSISAIVTTSMMLSTQSGLVNNLRTTNVDNSLIAHINSLVNMTGLQNCLGETLYDSSKFLPHMFKTLRKHSNTFFGSTTQVSVSQDPIVAPISEQTLNLLKTSVVVFTGNNIN